MITTKQIDVFECPECKKTYYDMQSAEKCERYCLLQKEQKILKAESLKISKLLNIHCCGYKCGDLKCKNRNGFYIDKSCYSPILEDEFIRALHIETALKKCDEEQIKKEIADARARIKDLFEEYRARYLLNKIKALKRLLNMLKNKEAVTNE